MDKSNGNFGKILSNYFVQCSFCREVLEFRTGFIIQQVRVDLKKMDWVNSLNHGYVCPKCVLENFSDIEFPSETQRLRWMNSQMSNVTTHLIQNFHDPEITENVFIEDDDIPF